MYKRQHARIKSINVEKARALNGVAAVLTYKDIDQSWLMGWPPMKRILGERVLYVGCLLYTSRGV